jgi:hypothetical protein
MRVGQARRTEVKGAIRTVRRLPLASSGDTITPGRVLPISEPRTGSSRTSQISNRFTPFVAEEISFEPVAVFRRERFRRVLGERLRPAAPRRRQWRERHPPILDAQFSLGAEAELVEHGLGQPDTTGIADGDDGDFHDQVITP